MRLKKVIWHLLSSIVNFFYNKRLNKNENILQSITNIEKNRIASIPRFQKGNTNMFNTNLIFVDSASFLFMYNEIFEKEIYKFNTNTLEPYIIDCGANIGLSVLYFKQLYPDSTIVAFEPDKNIYNVLKQNCEQFHLSKINLINKAVWDNEANLDFYAEGADGGRIAISSDQNNIIQIQTVRLKDFLANRKIDFLKIDIEGAETKVLCDCKNELINVKNIFIEYHSFVEHEQSLDIILSILKEAKFRVHINCPVQFSNQPFVKLNTSAKMDMQLNIYGIKK